MPRTRGIPCTATLTNGRRCNGKTFVVRNSLIESTMIRVRQCERCSKARNTVEQWLPGDVRELRKQLTPDERRMVRLESLNRWLTRVDTKLADKRSQLVLVRAATVLPRRPVLAKVIDGRLTITRYSSHSKRNATATELQNRIDRLTDERKTVAKRIRELRAEIGSYAVAVSEVSPKLVKRRKQAV